MSAVAVEQYATREAELEAQISERDSLDERLRAARENRELAESDLEGRKRDAHMALIAAERDYNEMYDGYHRALIDFDPALRNLDEASRTLDEAWRRAHNFGIDGIGVKPLPLRIPLQFLGRLPVCPNPRKEGNE